MLLTKIKNTILRQFFKQERRHTPPAGPKPALGGYIAKRDVAMKVTGPLSMDLWHWLTILGWREVNVKTNRRKFYRLPKDTLEQLVNANTFERELVYEALISTKFFK